MSLAKRVIVCLDVDHGRVVKGVQFEQLQAVGDPAELAAHYQRQGADEVVFLDISASIEGRGTFLDVVQRAAEQLFIPLTVGGGVSSVEAMQGALRAGAEKVSLNSAAVNDPGLITACAGRFGCQAVVVAIDAKHTRPGSWEVYTHGGRTATGLDAVAWAQHAVERGAGEILLTSMDADGTKDGYDLKLTRAVVDAVNVPVIASGGGGTPEHVRLAFCEGGAQAALAASIFHYGQFTVNQVKQHLQQHGLSVRPV